MRPAYERLSALDRSFLDLEDRNTHMHVASVCIFESGPLALPGGGVDIERIRRFMQARLNYIPRYRQRIETVPVEGSPVWVDDPGFNIHYHLRHVALPAPGSVRQLKRLCGRLASQRLDRGKPLWELWIVEGLDSGGFAVCAKVHHCMLDGVSGAELMQVLLSPIPVADESPPTQKWEPQPAPPPVELMRDALTRRVARPLALLSALREGARDPDTASKVIGDALPVLRDTLNTWSKTVSPSPINGKIGPHRRFDWICHDLGAVKRIKNRLGGTVNDVVLAIVSGALRRYFLARGLPDAHIAGLDFRVYCPVSVRSAEQRGTLGNQVTMLIADLPVGLADAEARLGAVCSETAGLKTSKQALGAKMLAEVGEWTPAALVTAAARLGYGNRANIVVTNVPGPQVPLYLLGARMKATYPLVPLYVNHGVGIALFSYAGKLFWGVNGDWDLIEDLHDIVEHIDAAFDELLELASPGEVHVRDAATRAICDGGADGAAASEAPASEA